MLTNIPVFEGLNCTINTTEDCNLRCKYCYEINKCAKNINLDVCYKFIDIITGPRDYWTDEMKKIAERGIVLDFIGGDSLMDYKTVDKCMEYFVYKMTVNWPDARWRFSLSTNGTLFSDPGVRAFCEKWKYDLSLGVSIDGCPELHDMNRVFPDGRGSMAEIIKWRPWYKETFPVEGLGTKSTLAKNSIPYIYDSLVFMHEELGLRYINQNFIMEDAHLTEEDLVEFDKQMEKCVDYVLQHSDDLFWSMIDRNFLERKKPDEPIKAESRCGSGCMPCLSIDGTIYPCFRWLPHTQNSETGITCGDVYVGMTTDGFRLVSDGSKRNVCTRDEKCLTCEYEPCCAYCIGGCYAEYQDFIRTTHICEITKLQAKWAEIYWRKYNEKSGNSERNG